MYADAGTRKGYLIERNIKLDELPSTLKSNIPDPVPSGHEVLVDIQSVFPGSPLSGALSGGGR